MSNSDTGDPPISTAEDGDAHHLADLDDGCGCVEVWEHLSHRRSAD